MPAVTKAAAGAAQPIQSIYSGMSSSDQSPGDEIDRFGFAPMRAFSLSGQKVGGRKSGLQPPHQLVVQTLLWARPRLSCSDPFGIDETDELGGLCQASFERRKHRPYLQMRVSTEVPETREPLLSKGSRLFRLACCKQVRRQIHQCGVHMGLPGSRSRPDDRFSASLNGLFDVSHAVLHHREIREGYVVKGS